jgi:hypothetical protein
MSDSIVAALISAVAALAVAIIGKYSPARVRPDGRPLPGFTRPPPSWLIAIGLLLVWLLVSPGAIHHDLAGDNYFVAPAVLLVLALVRPIRPLTAAWTSLAVFAANFVLGPISNRLAGSPHDTRFLLHPVLLLYVLIPTAIIAGVCAVRLRSSKMATATPSIPEPTSASDQTVSISLTAQLQELSALHKSGALTDDEFRQAKARLLR